MYSLTRQCTLSLAGYEIVLRDNVCSRTSRLRDNVYSLTSRLRDSATRQCILSHQAATCDCGTYVSKQPNVAGASWRCFFSLLSASSHFSVLLLTSTYSACALHFCDSSQTPWQSYWNCICHIQTQNSHNMFPTTAACRHKYAVCLAAA